ncbi:hypothetical protein D0B54_15860 [Solimonas sp. K1W22B-7]|uniref:hypothetical protein n=1 Tax=Solimonas sp. K1W22B-7 TaxID=2303331 RepID=UPI000E335780|nr:hypothetical protein [Solimonas sp. K1W22B-7]AXQ30054.1 hypothetical protein D0B54_15860 [Solimonas sp. K1W22B-7]
MLMNRRSFLSRSALIAAGAVVPAALTGCGGGRSGADDSKATGLSVHLNGREVARQEVLEWEARRLQVIAKRMSQNLPAALVGELVALLLRPEVSTANIAQERVALAEAKILAGDEAMRRLVATDLLLTNQIVELAVAAPLGWSVCEIGIVSNRGSAEGFARWFNDKSFHDDPYAMLVACPDHFLLKAVPPRGMEVIEITGGAMQASRFLIDYDNLGDLPLVIDPDFPVRFSGAAVNGNGTVIGGLNHRFRTLAEGFESHLAIVFPAALPPWMISEHRWHLACEFSNWITAYIEETGDR